MLRCRLAGVECQGCRHDFDLRRRQLEAQAPAEMLAAVVADPRAAIQHALADARQRFGDGDPLVREWRNTGTAEE